MNPLSNLDKTTQEQLLLETYIEFEQQHNTGSDTNVLVHLREKLELAGAIQLGLFVACFTIFLNFLIVNLILHLQ